MDPANVLNLSLGATGILLKGEDSHDLDFSLQEYKGPVTGPRASGPNRLKSMVFSVLFYSILSLCTLNKESKEALIRDGIQREQFHVCAVFLVKI